MQANCGQMAIHLHNNGVLCLADILFATVGTYAVDKLSDFLFCLFCQVMDNVYNFLVSGIVVMLISLQKVDRTIWPLLIKVSLRFLGLLCP